MESICPSLSIQVTNICNANCIFCAYQYQDGFCKARGVMSDATYEKVLSDYKIMGGTSILFTSLVGEPLVDPKIIDRLNYARNVGFDVGMITNGVLLNRLDLESFLKVGLCFFMISTAPFDETMYESIYRHRRYSDLLAGLIRLLSLRKALGTDLCVNLAFRSQIPGKKVRTLPDFCQHIWPLLTSRERSKIIVVTNSFDDWNGQIRQKDLLEGMRLAQTPWLKLRPCAQTFQLMIQWNGQVRACSCRFNGKESIAGDELFVGDITKKSLAEIWAGQEIRGIRRGFVRGRAPLICGDCTIYSSC